MKKTILPKQDKISLPLTSVIIGTVLFIVALMPIQTLAQSERERLEEISLLVPNYLDSNNYEIYTSAKNTESERNLPDYNAKKHFSCKEQMFSVIAINNKEFIKDYTVIIPAYIKWINPQGHVQERTQIQIPLFNGKGRSFAWLKLHQPSGASMLGFVNDTLGLEEFIGDWTIQLEINNQTISEYPFSVLC